MAAILDQTSLKLPTNTLPTITGRRRTNSHRSHRARRPVTRDPRKREARAWPNTRVHHSSCAKEPADMGQPKTEEAWGRSSTLLSLWPVSLSHVRGTTGGLFTTAALHIQPLGPARQPAAAHIWGLHLPAQRMPQASRPSHTSAPATRLNAAAAPPHQASGPGQAGGQARGQHAEELSLGRLPTGSNPSAGRQQEPPRPRPTRLPLASAWPGRHLEV